MKTHDARGRDAYFTPIEAVNSLVGIERLPSVIIEPAAGNGAIVKPLSKAGHIVIPSDIHDYNTGYPVSDYLKSAKNDWRGSDVGIVTNPPYKHALSFAEKAVQESDYVAFLLRLAWLESMNRYVFFKVSPPNRVHVASRRLPPMYPFDWDGDKTTSNVCFAWFVWDRSSNGQTEIKWFDWANYN